MDELSITVLKNPVIALLVMIFTHLDGQIIAVPWTYINKHMYSVLAVPKNFPLLQMTIT